MKKVKRIISLVTSLVMTLSVFNFYAFNHQVKAATNISSNRLSGNDRCETAAKIAEAGWKNTSDYAIISTAKDFPDALCAAPLAKKYNAPILLTNSDSLNDYAKAELLRLHVKNAIIIGGTRVISQNVEDQIKVLGISTNRIAGDNRYETSEKIAEQIGSSKQVVIATGQDFPDALSIAPIAAMKGMPILLTEKDCIPDEITPYLKSNNFTNTYVIGGSGVVNETVLSELQNPKRISGTNRYDTNIAVINQFKSDLNQSTVYMATGDNFPDALACSVLSSMGSSPLLLINDNPSDSTKTYVKNNNSITNINVIGGTSIISDNLVQNEINGSWIVPTSAQTSGVIPSDNTDITSKFTDEIFKADIYELIGKTSPAPIRYSDVKNITTLNLEKEDIKNLEPINSLSGIEYFTSLKDLNCGYNQLTTLDVSKNTALESLWCEGNHITALDVSKNTKLTFLLFDSDQLTTLDVSKNTKLKRLLFCCKKLKTIDVSKNTALTALSCAYCQLTKLDVSKNAALVSLVCDHNQLTTLDVSKNTSLSGFDCSYNQLRTLDVSKNTALQMLDCQYNQLTTLYINNQLTKWHSKDSSYNPQYIDSTRTTLRNIVVKIKK